MPQRIQVPGYGIVEFPDGMTGAQIVKAIQKRFPVTASAPLAQPEKYDPTEGMSTADKTLAGIGKAFVDTGRGIGQLFGLVSREDIARSRELDKALMNTTAGKWANLFGEVATSLPLLAVPGANTVKGASLIGAAYGLARPSESTTETLSNIALNGAGGGVGLVAGKLLGKGVNASKIAIEPMSNAGQDRILGNFLKKQAGGGKYADDAIVSLHTVKAPVAGIEMTAGQAANNPGIAALERAVTAMQPETAMTMWQRLDNQQKVLANILAEAASQSKTGRAIQNAATNPLDGSIQAEAFARALRDQTAHSFTRPKIMTLQNKLSPETAQTLEGIRRTLQATEFARTAGREPGVETLQKLAFSNMENAPGVLKFISNLGGDGMGGVASRAGEGMGGGASQALGGIASGAVNMIYDRANKAMAKKLAEAMFHPQEVARLMQIKQLPLGEYKTLAMLLGNMGIHSPALIDRVFE